MYRQLQKHFDRYFKLKHLLEMASWDEAVMMPEGAGSIKGETLAEVKVMMHEMLTDAKSIDLAQQVEEQNSELDSWQKANLKWILRHQRQALAVKPETVERLSLASSRCEQAWRSLRKENNWKAYQPLLNEVFEACRDEANQLAEVSAVTPYEALLDMYDPRLKLQTVESSFSLIRQRLPDMIQQVLEKQKSYEYKDFSGHFAVEDQRAMALQIMRDLGFDFNHGRLDVSHHPFCGGAAGDVRLTTKYDTEDFTQALMGVIHETGHSMYEQGLPIDQWKTFAGQTCSMTLHESQSLLFEMQMARSREFLSYLEPLIKKYLKFGKDAGKLWNTDDLYRYYIKVEPGFIRIDADEMTYPLHVILRFEIEKALFENELSIDSLPECWDQKMKQYLNIDTKGNYADGCMQDVHWGSGAFGYFPTYTLGAMAAAQIFAAAQKQVTGLMEKISVGDFESLTGWLRQQIWQKASIEDPHQVIAEASGGPLGAEALLEHLRERYVNFE